jgi:hypothetical protein
MTLRLIQEAASKTTATRERILERMRAVEPDAHTGRLRALARRLVARLSPRAPGCAFCPAAANDAWMIDPLGRVHGLCPHCLERKRLVRGG